MHQNLEYNTLKAPEETYLLILTYAPCPNTRPIIKMQPVVEGWET